MVTTCFHEEKYSGARTEIGKFLSLQNYQIWRAYKKHVWSDYDCLMSIDTADLSPMARWRHCPLFVFGQIPMSELIDPLTDTGRQKIFKRLTHVNGLAAQYEMVRQIKDFPLVLKILQNSAVQSGRPDDIMKVVMSELLTGESEIDQLIEHLEKQWPEQIVEYILSRACGLSQEQIRSFKGQDASTSAAISAVSMTASCDTKCSAEGGLRESSATIPAQLSSRSIDNHSLYMSAEHKKIFAAATSMSGQSHKHQGKSRGYDPKHLRERAPRSPALIQTAVSAV